MKVGKKAALRVAPSACNPQFFRIDSKICYGYVTNGSRAKGGGLLLWMNEQNKHKVQYLTFTASEAVGSLADGQAAVAPRQVVTFQLLTDVQQQLLYEEGMSSSQHAAHAYLQATNVTPLTSDAEVALDPALQQQLFVLRALADTFHDQPQPA
eukprot:gene8166-8357_t